MFRLVPMHQLKSGAQSGVHGEPGPDIFDVRYAALHGRLELARSEAAAGPQEAVPAAPSAVNGLLAKSRGA